LRSAFTDARTVGATAAIDSPVASVVAISAIVASPGVVDVGAEIRRAAFGRGD
jgi:hypothetical protein